MEILPAKVTDAAKKRQEAVRKVLDQRKKAEDEEERWKETQKQRQKKLQKVVLKRAQANDPHLALSQTCQSKLKEFRKQDIQRRKEYQREIKEIQERVKGRPLLLEQVAQKNAKQVAEKRYVDTLRGCGLSVDFINSQLPQSQHPGTLGLSHDASLSSDSKLSDKEEIDLADTPVHYRKVYLEDDDDLSNEGSLEVGAEQRGEWKNMDGSNKEEEEDGSHLSSREGEDIGQYSDDDDDYNYSDDHENFSEDSGQDLAQSPEDSGGRRSSSQHSQKSQSSKDNHRNYKVKLAN